MRSALLKKLNSRRGESLAEVLISMLIIALAVLLLAVMLSTAGSLDRQTRVRDGHFYEELTAAEIYDTYDEDGGAAVPSDPKIDIKIEKYDGTKWEPDTEAGDIPPIDVDPYGGSHLLSYTPD